MTPLSKSLIFVMTLLLVLGGFSGVASAAPAAQATPAAYGTRTVTDCTGTTSTFTSPPSRVVAVTTSQLELLVELGLQDRIIGTQAAAPGAYPADVQAIAETIPKLGGEYVPGSYVPIQREDMLTAEPDFVVGGWPSNFDASLGALSQQDLTERSINSYYAYSVTCERGGPATDLSILYQDITNYGIIFDIEETAATVISQMQATVADVQARVGDAPQPRVFTYSWEDGRGEAYAAGSQHTANAIIGLAGGANIFSDIDAVYGSVGWEEVIARDPEFIVIEVFGKGTQEEFDAVVAEAKDFFASDPALQNLTAVRNGAFIPIVAETYYVGGVRNADAVELLAQALHPDVFAQ